MKEALLHALACYPIKLVQHKPPAVRAETIATVGVLVVEGGILGFGMLFLGPILFFSFWGALIAVGLFTAAFYGLRASSITLSTAQSVTGDSGIVGGSVGLAKNALATTADLMEKAEAVVVGREGLPVPIAGRV
ncbi:hypothetical protein H9P43_003181 [Blastocladiella emersonii ATCC 22665]|nr:hypothetical protein H9P43_003181 [Blastocladiella emersonii ATCC 22665]